MMGDHAIPSLLVPVLLTLLLLDFASIDRPAGGVAAIHIRQTFYDSDDYSAPSNAAGGDFEGDRGRGSRAFDYEDAGGYQEGDDGSKKQGSYAIGGAAADDDAYAGYQSPAAAHEPRSSQRDSYEPVYHKKSKSTRGHSGGYNDEDDNDDDGYQKKKTKKKVRPKVIIVKKIIPLSTTTAVNVP